MLSIQTILKDNNMKILKMIKPLVFVIALLFCGQMSAGPPSYQARSTFTQKIKTTSRTTSYGVRSYSTRVSGGYKVNSVPYGTGYINRHYNSSGFLMDTSVSVQYGNGWLVR